MFRLMRRHRFLMRCHRLLVTAFIRFHRFLVTAFIRRHRLRVALIVGKALLIQSPGTVFVAAIHGRNTAPDSYGSDNGCQGGNTPTNGRNPCQSQARLLKGHSRNFKFAHRMSLLIARDLSCLVVNPEPRTGKIAHSPAGKMANPGEGRRVLSSVFHRHTAPHRPTAARPTAPPPPPRASILTAPAALPHSVPCHSDGIPPRSAA